MRLAFERRVRNARWHRMEHLHRRIAANLCGADDFPFAITRLDFRQCRDVAGSDPISQFEDRGSEMDKARSAASWRATLHRVQLKERLRLTTIHQIGVCRNGDQWANAVYAWKLSAVQPTHQERPLEITRGGIGPAS
jgi:hypothetical protein